jgi:site-specific DNA-adenine methylase
VFYYYGGKRRLARFYPPPKHDVVVEPFAGSAAYSVHHLREGLVERAILVEKDPRVCEIWNQLLAMEPDEVLAYAIPKDGDRTSDFLVMTSACSNRIARTAEMTVTKRMPVVLERMFKQIAAVLPHVKGRVQVIEGDYTKAPDVEATWFVDPPYHVNGRPQQRGMGYAEGCNSDSLDYEVLAGWCRRRPGQKIVCEQAGAKWLPFEHLRWARDSLGNHAAEVAWVEPPVLDIPAPAKTREYSSDLLTPEPLAVTKSEDESWAGRGR